MKMLFATLSASILLAGPAMSGLIIVDGVDPEVVPVINDFKADLAGLGFDSLYDGGADIMATQSGTVLFYYHAAESGFANQFVVGGTVVGDDLIPGTVLKTEANEPFSAPGAFIGSIDITAGQKFSGLGIGFNVVAGDAQQLDAPAGTQGFGVFFDSATGGNGVIYPQVFFGFDDNGANRDDNHDDMIISAVFVPEPGSVALMLAGLALIVRRRR